MRVFIVLFTLIYFQALSLVGQYDSRALDFKVFDSEDGLSSDFVNSIAEDDRGFLWVGSRSGLNYYDGSSNKIFVHNVEDEASLSTNDISCVLNIGNDLILAGTWGKSLNIVNTVTKKIKRAGASGEKNDLFIKDLLQKNDSVVWVGTYEDGLLEYNVKTDVFSRIVIKSDSLLEPVQFDFCQGMTFLDDKLWVCSNEGDLAYLNPVTNELQLYGVVNGIVTQDFGEVRDLTSLNGELVAANTDGDIHFLDPVTGDSRKVEMFFRPRSNNKIEQLYEVDGKIWANSIFELKYYDSLTDKVVKVVSPDGGVDFNNVFCVFQDSRGMFWIGTWGGGLKMYIKRANQFKSVRFNEKDLFVNDLEEVDGTYVLVATKRGIHRYNKKTYRNQKIYFRGEVGAILNSENILGIVKYKSGYLISTYEGGIYMLHSDFSVSVFKTDKGKSSFNNETITFFQLLPNGQIWIGSWTSGALLIDPKERIPNHFVHEDANASSIPSNGVLTAFESKNGTVYLGTKSGVCTYETESGEFSSIDINNKILNSNENVPEISSVRSILEDSSGRLWIASIDGVFVYDPVKKASHFLNVKSGLADNLIYSLVLSGDHIWATSKLGLSRIRIDDFTITNFNTNNGLPLNTFSENGVLISTNGNLYLGMTSGFVYFDPSTLKYYENKAELNITNLYIDDKLVTPDQEAYKGLINDEETLVLDYDENNLAFEVAIKDFESISKRRHFVHKMEGVDEKWINYNSGQEVVRYTNLPSGKYQLRISEVLDNGKIEQEGLKLTVKIKRPIWEKWWFIVIVSVLVLAAVFFLIRHRTRKIKRQNRMLEDKVALRTEEIKRSNQELRTQREALDGNVRYASRLQNSLLPKRDKVDQGFQENFIFFKPRDVVSGDFYWYEKIGSKKILVAADCTGHGVSGAFVSVMGITFLKTIVRTMKVTNPSKILRLLHEEMNMSFNEENGKIRDGMDISILCYDEETKILEVSSAMNSVLLVDQNKNVRRIKGDKLPIGGDEKAYKNMGDYTLHSIPVDEKCMVYIFSDGFQDQFGGERGSKFMSTTFRELLAENSSLSITEQYDILEKTFYDWKGDYKQVDDVLVMGIAISPSE